MSAADLAAASLIERFLEGSLDASGRAELAALLRRDEQARRLLSQQIDLSNLLAEQFTGEDFASATVDRVLAARANQAPRAADPARLASARYRRSPSLHAPRAGRRARRALGGHAFFQRLALAAASLALLLGGWALLGQRQAPITLVATATEGDGTLLRSGRELPFAAGTELAAGDELHASSDATLAARYGDGTRLRLRPGAVAALQPEAAEGGAADPAKRVRLMRGTLDAEVAKQPPDAPMVIATADAEATVVGTSLSFATGVEGTRLEVAHGEVRLTRAADGRSITVAGGQVGEVAPGVAFVARPLNPPAVAVAQAATPSEPIPAAPPAQGPPKPARKSVLLLRQHADDDLAVEARLRQLGCDVVAMNDAASRTADAEGKDLIIIPESVLAKNVGTKFRDVRVPVMTWEGGIFADMGLGRPGTMITGGVVTIRDADSPLAAGKSGQVHVSTHAAEATAMRARPTKAHVIATLDTSAKDIAIFAYEPGQEMDEGMRAPARRVGFFLHGNSEKFLTADGWGLFDAAVRWCLREPVAGDGR